MELVGFNWRFAINSKKIEESQKLWKKHQPEQDPTFRAHNTVPLLHRVRQRRGYHTIVAAPEHISYTVGIPDQRLRHIRNA